MHKKPMIGFFAMNSDRSASSGRSARVLSFRRGQAAGHLRAHGSVPGLGKYERDERPDDYRHRMIVNMVAFLFVIFLVCVGYWLADTMARLRKDQDCVLSGRRGCSPVGIEIPRNRW
jgi:hypothetical protein